MNNRLFLEIGNRACLSLDGLGDESDVCFSLRDLKTFTTIVIAECISACATDRLGKTASAEDLINGHFGL